MRKSLVSAVLVLLLVISVFPISAFAAAVDEIPTVSPRSGAYDDRYEIGVDGVTYTVYKGANGEHIMIQGMTHPYVMIGQRALLNVKERFGLNFTGWSPVTDYFGTLTYTATVAFQQWWNDSLEYFYGSAIYVDGKIGDQCWRRFVTVCM